MDGADSKIDIHTIWNPNMLQACRLTICPDTVLLFELRIENPALRVTVQTFLTSRDAEAYAFGVRHVAPSPPARNEPGGDAPRHRHEKSQKLPIRSDFIAFTTRIEFGTIRCKDFYDYAKFRFKIFVKMLVNFFHFFSNFFEKLIKKIGC